MEPSAGITNSMLAMVLVLAAVGVEVVVEQNRNLAADNAGIGGLLGNDRLVLLEFLEKGDARIEVVQTAAHGQVGGHGRGIPHKRRSGIKVADHAFVFRLEQVRPGFRHRRAPQGILC